MNENKSLEINDGILVVTGDMHTNSLGGLMPPSVRKLSGNVVKANEAQRLLWRGWRKCWAAVGELKTRHQLPVFSVFNGDSVDRNKHDPWDAISANPADILHLAVKVLEPALDISDGWEFTRGTEAHVGKHQWFEDKLAADLGAERNGYGFAHPSLLLNVSGLIFDIRHHTESNSIRPWTKGAGAMRSSKIVQDYYLESNDRPPDWVVRNHVHHFEDSGRNRRPRAIFLPCWQAPGAWLHRIGLGTKMPEFGLVYFVCRGGRLVEWDLLTVEVKRSRPVKPRMKV